MYAANQVSSQWVIERIDLPNGEFITYQYTDGFLSQVNHPDGTESNFDYDVTDGLVTIDYRDAAAESTHRNKTVYLSTGMYVGTRGFPVFSQASLQVRAITNAEGELIYANFASPTNGNLRRVYTGSGKMAQVDGVFGTRYFENWSIAGDGYTGINGSLEPTFATIKGPGTSNAQMRLAIPPTYVDEQGRQYDMEYDSANYPTKRTYSDGTIERWEYDTALQGGNQFHLITRHEDRLGRVTEMEYDARGNLRFRRVGIINTKVYQQATPDTSDPPTDQQLTGEFAEYEWQYYPAAHPNQFLLQYAFDANDNRTEFLYNADQFLTKIIEPADNTGDPRAETEFAYDTAGRLQTSTDAENRTTNYFYDDRDRLIQIQYLDGSTERYAYGAAGSGEENLVIAQQDRTGFVSTMEYDDHGRLTKRITASHRIPQNLLADNTQTDLASLLTGNEVTDPNVRVEYTCSYLDGTSLRTSCTDGLTPPEQPAEPVPAPKPFWQQDILPPPSADGF